MVNDLLTRVRDIYQKLRSRLSALLSTPELLPPSEKAKPKASNLSPSQKALLRKHAASGKQAKGKK